MAKCVACAGKGFIWGRTNTIEKGRMAKRKCGYCKGTGEHNCSLASSRSVSGPAEHRLFICNICGEEWEKDVS